MPEQQIIKTYDQHWQVVAFDLPKMREPNFFKEVAEVSKVKKQLTPYTLIELLDELPNGQIIVATKRNFMSRIRTYLVNLKRKKLQAELLAKRVAYFKELDAQMSTKHVE